MGNRCTGHCCKAFVLNISYEDLRRAHEAHLRGEDRYMQVADEETIAKMDPGSVDDTNRYCWQRPLPQDVAIVYPMIIPLGEHMNHPISGKPVSMSGKPTHLYTCKNLQSNGDCGIYEARPRLCRDYPYAGDVCGYDGCTWDDAQRREALVPTESLTKVTELIAQLEETRSEKAVRGGGEEDALCAGGYQRGG